MAMGNCANTASSTGSRYSSLIFSGPLSCSILRWIILGSGYPFTCTHARSIISQIRNVRMELGEFTMSSRWLFLLGLCLTSAAPALYGQGATGTITGIVTDSAGAVISGANVQAVHVETGQVYQVASTGTGNYTLTTLPIGKYDLNVNVQGFKKYVHANMQIEAAQILREDVQLEIGASSESVTVTAEATLLKTESGELSHEVTVT